MGILARAIIAATALLLWAEQARTDSWIPPHVNAYFSENKAYRLTVHPRPFTDALNFFTDKVCGREPAGVPAGTVHRTARAVMERSDGNGGWTQVWAAPLVNEVAPVEAIITNEGRYAVTFDNWHSMGGGDHVVVIYDARGRLVRSLRLGDLLPENYVGALPRSISSTDWRGDPRFDGDEKTMIVEVVVPSVRERQKPDLIDLVIDLATGRPLQPSGVKWESALAAAATVTAAKSAAERKLEARFAAPLLGPASNDVRGWHDYLREAFHRIDPDWREGSTSTTVLRLPSARVYKRSEELVAEALSADFYGDEDRSFASPSQENLADVFAAEAAKLPPDALKGVRIRVAVTDALRDRFARALAHTGATFIQIDPTKPIPQRPERVAARFASQPIEPDPIEPDPCAAAAG